MTNTTYLQADVASVLADIDALFAAYPELQEDEDLRADMLEGSTDLHSVLTRLVAIERDADAMIKAIAERARDLSGRKARYDKRKEAMRALMLKVMQAAGATKAPLAEATVSVGKGRAGVDITDADALPDDMVRVERVPDKKAIMTALETGPVAGAVMREATPTVTVRAA